MTQHGFNIITEFCPYGDLFGYIKFSGYICYVIQRESHQNELLTYKICIIMIVTLFSTVILGSFVAKVYMEVSALKD